MLAALSRLPAAAGALPRAGLAAAGSPCWLHAAAALLAPVGEVERATDKSYIDRLKITARAGKGGSGCSSLWGSAAKGKRQPPDGGNGGDGGNVILRASSNMKSLAGVQQLYAAEAGQPGGKQKRHGRVGQDTVVLVPLGTVVWRLGAPPPGSDEAAADRATDGQQQQQAEEEEELPDWIKNWQQPWVGARDYRSDDESGSGSELEEGDEAVAGSGNSDGRRRRPEEQRTQIADLVEDGQEAVVARGGRGGLGNAATMRHVRPGAGAAAAAERAAAKRQGQTGEVARLLLELKLLADVGLVGLPNAGKSSLLRALSAAHPRVGAYPFTTLAPQLGVVTLDPSAFGDEGEEDGSSSSSRGSEGGSSDGSSDGSDSSSSGSSSGSAEERQQQRRQRWRAAASAFEPPRRLVAADIPGLIAGAHENRGLGHRFLRHIERTRALAYVVDLSGGSGEEGSNALRPWQQLELLQEELEAYSPALVELPALVIANKTDLLPEPAASLAELRRRTELPVVGVSAREGTGLGPLVKALAELVPVGRLGDS